jgi:hypothetical protein
LNRSGLTGEPATFGQANLWIDLDKYELTSER